VKKEKHRRLDPLIPGVPTQALLIIAQPCRWFCNLILEDNVQSVDDTGDPGEDGQADVDEEVSTAAALEEDAQRGEEEGKDDLANVGSGERHVDGVVYRNANVDVL